MTMMQFAFVLLCLAQIIHFSRHWVILSSSILEEMQDTRRRNAVNWKATRSR